MRIQVICAACQSYVVNSVADKTVPIAEKTKSVCVGAIAHRAVRRILHGEANVVVLYEVALTLNLSTCHLRPRYSVVTDDVVGGGFGASIAVARQIDSLEAKIMNVVVRDQIVRTDNIDSPALLRCPVSISDVKPDHAHVICLYLESLHPHSPIMLGIKTDGLAGMS